MDGEDLGATIRADALHDRTLTVLVTSAGNRGDAARARARGFAAYLSKPLEWDLLARLLVEVRHRAESAPGGRGAGAGHAALDGRGASGAGCASCWSRTAR